MNIDILINRNGRLCMAHDAPWPDAPPTCVGRYDDEIVLIFASGRREVVLHNLPSAFDTWTRHDTSVTIIRIENREPVEGWVTPFLFSPRRCWGLDCSMLRYVDRAGRPRLIYDGDENPTAGAWVDLADQRVVLRASDGRTLCDDPQVEGDILLEGATSRVGIVWFDDRELAHHLAQVRNAPRF